MRQEISPVLAAGVVVGIIAVIAAVLFFSNQNRAGSSAQLPLPEGVPAAMRGQSVRPMGGGMPGSMGASYQNTAPASTGAGLQNTAPVSGH